MYVCYSASLVTRLGSHSASAPSMTNSPSLKPSSATGSSIHSEEHVAAEDLPRTAVFRWNGWSLRKAFEPHTRFVVPVIRGYVGCTSLGSEDLHAALICRLSARRAGTRYNRRGLDGFGHAANFSETEQLVWKGGEVTSFTSIRGSVPVRWSQPSDLRFAPKISMPVEVDSEDIARHLRILSRLYEGVRFSFLDLLGSKTGSMELALSNRFRETVETHNTESKKVAVGPDSTVFHQVTYTRFDLNQELTNGIHDPLENTLRALLEAGHASHSSSSSDSATQVRMFSHWTVANDGHRTHLHTQPVIVRINCLDCLDRTNISQCRLSIHVFAEQLIQLGNDFAVGQDIALRKLWVQHGNQLSQLYTGSTAHGESIITPPPNTLSWGAKANKTVHLRTALQRWVNNNFFDGAKQDVITLITGDHTPSTAIIGEQPIYKGLTLDVLAVATAYSVCLVAMLINLMAFIADGHSVHTFAAIEMGWLTLLVTLVALTVTRGGRSVAISPVLPESRRYL
eukprot:GILI01022634.1.p1 GENE.GILI01022634.1~~GILI01022634.1.p1  ORF type:complete len:511 (-),score=45.27 GILI01022634.1:26-1558(-)